MPLAKAVFAIPPTQVTDEEKNKQTLFQVCLFKFLIRLAISNKIRKNKEV